MGACASREIHGRSVPVGNSEDPDESPVFVNSIRLKENGGSPMSTLRCQPDSRTTTAMLDRCAVMYENCDAFGERRRLNEDEFGEYVWMKFPAFRQRCLDFAAGMQGLGLSKGDKVAIFCQNSLVWQTVHFGLHYLGAVPVAVNATTSVDEAALITRHSECKAVVVRQQNVQQVREIAPDMLAICVCDVVGDEVLSVEEVIRRGRSNKEFTPYQADPKDTAIIMYTSGAMGSPKGCVLTHENIIAGAAGLSVTGISLGPGDTFFSFLPLGHVYELCVELMMTGQGVRIGFFSGDRRDMLVDAQELQPTVFCGVPRMFRRIVEKIKVDIDNSSPVLRWILKWAINVRMHTSDANSLFLDMTLFSRFKELLGGKVRVIVSGGAPILSEHCQLLKATITPNVIQGYGATEFASAGCVQEVGASTPMTVGPVNVATDMKFRRVEGMDYDPKADPPSGELLFRGPAVFPGYYKDDKATSEAMSDGWFASGDVGSLTSDGQIEIIDRVSLFVKLSHGEFISLSKLSNIYSHAFGVAHAYVFADSHHSQPVAVVVPNQTMTEDWCARGITDFEHSKYAKSELLEHLAATAEKSKLRPFECLLDILLESEVFTVENGLLTASQKLQLQSLRLKYEVRLLELYDNQPEL